MSSSGIVDVDELVAAVRRFTAERDWEQFHAPKNLLLALVGEVGELAELFQWLTDEQISRIHKDHDVKQRIRDELADVLYYLLRLSDVLDVDLGEALVAKLVTNAQKYPIERARGSAAKYTDL